MEIAATVRIFEALAGGVDPITGEVFPQDHCLQKAEVVRALYTAISVLKRKLGKVEIEAGAETGLG